MIVISPEHAGPLSPERREEALDLLRSKGHMPANIGRKTKQFDILLRR